MIEACRMRLIRSHFVFPFCMGAIIALALVGGAIYAGSLRTQNPSFMCPPVVGGPTSFNGNGFVMSKPTGFAGGMQFVIKPNSTAFLDTTYYIANISSSINAKTIYANWTHYFRPIEYWYRLGSGNSSRYGPWLNASQVGMTAFPVNVTANGNHIVTSTYEISASPNAQQGAYIGNWFAQCPPQTVLTIGYTPYNGAGLPGGAYM